MISLLISSHNNLQPDKFKPEPSNTEEKNAILKAKHEEKFVKVSHAYDILSDEKKRKAWDKYGQNGLDMLEKGIDPEEAGFGGGFGGGGGGGGFPGGNFHFGGGGGGFPGGFPGGAGGFGGGSFGNADAQKIFASMFGGGGGGGASFDFGSMFGGGGGQQRQQRQQQQQKKPEAIFKKDDPSGVVPLGRPKFPDAKAKNAWLVLFYEREQAQRDSTTQQYISHAKQISEGVMKKAKSKNGVIFKVGAVDCSADKMFCEKKLGKSVGIPRFAVVLNGNVQAIDKATASSAKKLHDRTVQGMNSMDGLVVNVNSMKHVKERLLSSSGKRGKPIVSILLLSDKYETSPIYSALSYKHRHDGFVGFGESRGSNLALGKDFEVKKYPTLVALVGNTPLVEAYTGDSFDLESLSKWVEYTKKVYLDG